LVEELVVVLKVEFKDYLPDFIPIILHVINNDVGSRNNAIKVFGQLKAMGANLDGYLHLIVPAIVNLF
jgi:hypothetical protein